MKNENALMRRQKTCCGTLLGKQRAKLTRSTLEKSPVRKETGDLENAIVNEIDMENKANICV